MSRLIFDRCLIPPSASNQTPGGCPARALSPVKLSLLTRPLLAGSADFHVRRPAALCVHTTQCYHKPSCESTLFSFPDPLVTCFSLKAHRLDGHADIPHRKNKINPLCGVTLRQTEAMKTYLCNTNTAVILVFFFEAKAISCACISTHL